MAQCIGGRAACGPPPAAHASSADSATHASTADSATSATGAANAAALGGHSYGFAHIIYSGTTPTIDTSQSSAGVSVTGGMGTTCVQPPFAPKAAVASVDFLTSSTNEDVAQAAPITGGIHVCAAGKVEVNTEPAAGGSAVNDAYYVFFSG